MLSRMDGTLLFLMTMYAMLNGLGVVLAKKELIDGNYDFFTQPNFNIKYTIKELVRIVKTVLSRKIFLISILIMVLSFFFTRFP